MAVRRARAANKARKARCVIGGKARTVLARVDGDIAVPGIKEPVEVLRDRWGVPHVYASDIHDLFFATNFVSASERLFQLDFMMLETSKSSR